MPVQTVDTFSALISCFGSDLAHLLEETTPRNPSPTDFIYLVERTRDILASSSLGNLNDAGEDLDAAISYLTDALESDPADKRVLLARARTHLRDAIETAS
ncbi:hypothetical protein ACFYN3_41800 [Streptomyces lavendulae]|uniref:hypothetical protein n=1 Tax=Streptomyces lavendulae TaxID=1914 RepID=UPI0036BC8768